MFYLGYMLSELRRRKGRTLLTALGLGVGVGLVVTVSALSKGLDNAQEKVLEPLTGVGTDMSVTRPLKFTDNGQQGPAASRQSERDQLQKENGRGASTSATRRKPGEKFTRTDFMSAAQLSFPASQVRQDRQARRRAGRRRQPHAQRGDDQGHGAQAAASSGRRRAAAAGRRPQRAPFDFNSLSVTGVDQTKPALGADRPDQITKGRYLTTGAAREAVLNESYARRNGLERRQDGHARRQVLHGRRARELAARRPGLRRLREARASCRSSSDREGRVNTVQVRADSGDDVAAVAKAIKATMTGASVTTAADLADRVGGSLVDAKNLSGKLGTALTIVALVAAFLIASLLTLSSVTKRIRELGTLKALGWPQRKVVRQVTGESLLQGALGGVLGALIGIGGAALDDRARRRRSRRRSPAPSGAARRARAAGRAGRRRLRPRPGRRQARAPRSRSTRPSTSA